MRLLTLVALLVGVLVAFGFSMRAQSPLAGGRVDPAYRPRFEKGNQFYRLHPYSDGRLLVELSPDSVDLSGTEVRRLARVLADGSVDASFAAPAFLTNAFVRGLFPQADGGVYVYLSPPYDGLGSESRTGILHVTPDGLRDEGFRLPSMAENEAWHLLAVQPDGRLLVVRDPPAPFYGTHHQLVRLLSNGDLDPSFACAVNDGRAFLGAWLLGDGRIAVQYSPWEQVSQGHGGSLWTRLESGGAVDTGYQPPSERSVTLPDRVAVGPDGSVFMVGYSIDSSAGDGRIRAAHLLPDGSLNSEFQPSMDIYSSLEATASGHWRVLSQESGTAPYGSMIVELDMKGAVVSRRRLPEVVQDVPFPKVIELAGSKLLISAEFLVTVASNEGSIQQQWRFEARLFSSANHPLGFHPPFVSRAVTPPTPTTFLDGTLLFSAWNSPFDSVNGRSPGGPAVLSPGGELDMPFTRWLQDHDAWTFLSMADGRVLAHDHSSGWLAQLERDGTQQPMAIATYLIPSLVGIQLQSDHSQVYVSDKVIRLSREDPRRPTEVRSDRPQGNSRGRVLPDDRVLVWGSFTGVGGWISPGVARLRHDLVPDRSFRSALPAGSRTQAGCVQSDGRVLLAQGPSAGVNGPGSAELRRLMDDGTLDPTFHSPGRLDGPVHALTVDHQGRILVAGAFRKIDGRPLASVIRLNPDGSLDDSFVRGGGADRAVRALFVQPDGNVVAHGDFRRFDGQECWGLVRVGGGIPPHVEPRVLGVSSSRSAEAGERVVLGAVTAGEAPLSFQWFRSGESLANQTNVTLLLPAFASADAGVYELRVTNRHGVAWGPPRELRLSERESEPPVLSALLQQGEATTRVLLGLAADPAGKFRVEGSSDLSTWIPVEAVLSPNAFVEVARLPGAEISHRCYRVVSRP